MAEPSVLPLVPSVKSPSSKVELLNAFLKSKYLTGGISFRNYGRGYRGRLRASCADRGWDLGASARRRMKVSAPTSSGVSGDGGLGRGRALVQVRTGPNFTGTPIS